MEQAFLQYFFDQLKIAKKDKILLAVSGGLDSTVMCHLFKKSGLQFAIAHCNFQLRGSDSDADEVFVNELADNLGVKTFTVRFNTISFADSKKLSIQEAARELRYGWLNDIAIRNGFNWVATAHHQDDSIETMLFNLIKGCGVRGLHGILPKQNKVIRPLMFTGRKELQHWAKVNDIVWREDASNATDKYDRNKIRHHIIPEIEKINPAFRKTAFESIRRFSEAQVINDLFVARVRDEAFCMVNGNLYLKKEALQFEEENRTLLFELLSPFGFNNSQTDQILSRFAEAPGGIFYSPTHQILNDRLYLVILPHFDKNVEDTIKVEELTQSINLPDGSLILEPLDHVPSSFPENPNLAFLDANKIKLPLSLRRWKPGDRFQPFGMNGHSKKLQDFFNDSKLSRFDKEQVWILESEGEICWIVGMRTDERFKIDDKTTRCLKLTWVSGSFAEQHQPYNHFHIRKS